MNISVWFSCGAASAVASKLTLTRYPDDNVRILNTPIVEEDSDNRRFLRDVEEWLGTEIETVRNPTWNDSAVEVWDRRRFMSSPAGAPCTGELKKEARRKWQENNHVDFHVLGFTVDEKKRHEQFVRTEISNVLPVLIEAGFTKQQCAKFLVAHGIELPRMYSLGYPNANCIGCVKATSPTYWNHVRKTHPDVFEDRAKQSREIGCRLARVRGKRVFLDELESDAKGAPMKSLRFSCGSFCEEYSET